MNKKRLYNDVLLNAVPLLVDKFTAAGNNGGDVVELTLVHSHKTDNDDLVHIKIGQSCVYEYSKVVPVQVLVAFLLKHLRECEYDITASANDCSLHVLSLVRDANNVLTVTDDDERVQTLQESIEYTTTEPKCLVRIRNNNSNEFLYCIDEETTHPGLIELIHDSVDSADIIGTPGVYCCTFTVHDTSGWTDAGYEYDCEVVAHGVTRVCA